MTTDQQAPTTTGDDDPLAGSPRGRLAISVLILAILFCAAISTMPPSVLRGEALTVVRPVLGATNLEQGWGVFANPRQLSSVVVTRIDHADGSVTVLEPPAPVGPSAYWEYRWRNLLSQLGGRDREADRLAYARWVAATDLAAGEEPVRVTLIRRGSEMKAPGPGPDFGPPQENVVFSLEVGR